MSSSSILLGDIDKSIDFSVLKTCYLQSNDGKVSIMVDPKKVSECESMKVRCKVVEDVGYITIDTSDPHIICELSIALGFDTRRSKIDDALLFTYSLADKTLEHMLHDSYEGFSVMLTNSLSVYPDYNKDRIDQVDEDFSREVDEQQLDVTPELLEYSPEYLLSCNNKLKAAFSHPDLYKCDVDMLRYATMELYNQDITFIRSGKGEAVFFTSEYENLPPLITDKLEDYPLRIYDDNRSFIETSGVSAYRVPPTYKQMKRELCARLGEYNEIRSLLQHGYGVIVGSWIVSNIFYKADTTKIIICARNKEFVPHILSIFKNAEITSQSANETEFAYKGDRYKVVIPQVSYEHYTTCQPYGIDRCYTDGKEIYMGLSCITSLVGGIVDVRGKFFDINRTIELLQCGYGFWLPQIPDDRYNEIKESINITTRYIITNDNISEQGTLSIIRTLRGLMCRYI